MCVRRSADTAYQHETESRPGESVKRVSDHGDLSVECSHALDERGAVTNRMLRGRVESQWQRSHLPSHHDLHASGVRCERLIGTAEPWTTHGGLVRWLCFIAVMGWCSIVFGTILHSRVTSDSSTEGVWQTSVWSPAWRSSASHDPTRRR